MKRVNITRLSRRFSALLRAELDLSQVSAMIHTNARPEYKDACASHNYCDANMTMLKAYAELAEVSENDVDIAGDLFQNQVNSAWSMAKRAKFYPTAAHVPTLRAIGLASLQSESDRLSDEPLHDEQVDCYMDEEHFAEAHGMLNDLEARLGFDVDLARSCLGSKIQTLLNTYPNLQLFNSGGNCTALRYNLSNGGFLLLTTEGDASAPDDSDERVDCGYYPNEEADEQTEGYDIQTRTLDGVAEWIESYWRK